MFVFDIKFLPKDRLFNCFSADFNVGISRNQSEPIFLTREMLYDNINKQFSWKVEDIVSALDDCYRHKADLKGLIVASKKPMKPDLRGISLYSNGRLVNAAGFFGVPEAGHAFTYLSGWRGEQGDIPLSPTTCRRNFLFEFLTEFFLKSGIIIQRR